MRAQYRVMGEWTLEAPKAWISDPKQQETLTRFLVTLGKSTDDCLARLHGALSEYSRQDLDQIEWMWLEKWNPDRRKWEAFRSIDMEQLRRNFDRVSAKNESQPGQ